MRLTESLGYMLSKRLGERLCGSLGLEFRCEVGLEDGKGKG